MLNHKNFKNYFQSSFWKKFFVVFFIFILSFSLSIKNVNAVGDGSGMLIYDEDGLNNTTPHYRTWDTADFSSEGQLQNDEDASDDTNHTIIVAAPTRDEYIAGRLIHLGELDIQVYNGSSWVDGTSAPTNGDFTTGIGTTNDIYRGFDIAYEATSGDGIVVYESSSSGDGLLKYRTWDGSAWSGESSLDYSGVDEGNDVALWVECEGDYDSNNILCAWQEATGDGIYGARWDGSAWQHITLLNGAGQGGVYQNFDVAWEGSGDGMVVYGLEASTWIDGKVYTTGGGFADAATDPTGPATATNSWIRLAGSPNHDYIALSYIEDVSASSSDYGVDMWNGSSWSTVSVPAEDIDINSFGFAQGSDVAWEYGSSSDRALYVWRDGTTSETALRYMVFDISVGQFLAIDDDGVGQGICNLAGTATNQQVTSLSNAEGSSGPCTGLGAWASTVAGISLKSDPSSRKIMVVAEPTTADLTPEAQQWNGVDGGTWLTQTSNMSFETDLSTGATLSASLPTRAYDFAYTNVFKISGTTDHADGSNIVKVAVNGVVGAATGSISSGAWSIIPTTAPTSGQVVTVFIDGQADANEATAITKYDGTGPITGMLLFQGITSIASADNQSLSLTDMDLYSCADDEDVTFSVVSSVFNAEGQSCAGSVNNSYTNETFYVGTGDTVTLATSETITTEKLDNVGTITVSGNGVINVAGTSGPLFTSSGTFTAGNGTVNITGNASTTLNSGSPAFYNLVLSGTGTKTLGGAISVTNNLNISAGSVDDAGYQITGNASGTLSLASSSYLYLGSAGTATTFPTSFTNGNISLNALSTVVYQAGVSQTVSGVPTYGILSINPLSGTPTMTLGAATVVSSSLTVSGGTLATGDYALTSRSITVSGSASMTLGSSLVTITGSSTAWNYTSSSAISAGTSTIKFLESTGTATAKSFVGGGKTYNILWFAPASSGTTTGTITITGSNTFSEFKDTNNGSGAAHSILFTAGTTQTVTTWTVSGTAGNLITINSGDGAGGTSTSVHNLSKSSSQVSSDYLNIQHSVAGGGADWYAGANSTNNQGTADAGSGWIFSAAPVPINITVNASATTCTGAPSYTGTSDCNILNTDINTYLNSGTTVTLTAYQGSVTFSNGISKTSGGNATLNVYAGTNIIQSAQIGSSTGELNILYNADRQLGGSGYVNIAGGISTNGGDITIGGGSGTISAGSGFAVGNSGQSYGVYINGVTVAAGGGNIIINGRGYNTTTNNNHGVYVTGASGAITTTGSGTIDIKANGAGSDQSGVNYGLFVDAGAIISSVDGNLTVANSTGGGAGTGTQNYGVFVNGADSAIKTTGSGNLSITGTGGNASGSGSNAGIILNSSATITTTGSGNLSVTGTGGNGSGSGNFNIGIIAYAPISSAGGTMTIIGAGGASTGSYNYGIQAVSTISNTGSGTVSITGTGGGVTNSGYNYGLYLNSGTTFSSVNGNLTATGTGGGAGAGVNNYGVFIDFTGSSVKTTGSGNITVNGVRGGGDTATNYGLYITTENAIQTTSTGNITVSTDKIYLEEANDINSIGNLTISPYLASTTMGVGAGSGTLAMSDTYLGYIAWGTSSTLTLGNSTSGDLSIDTGSTILNKSVTFISGADMTLSTTALAHAGGSAATLTMKADEDIIISSAITAATSALTVLLQSDFDANTSGYVSIGASITSNGGNITIGGGSGTISAGSGYSYGNAGQAYGVYVNNVAITAGGGNIIINGRGYSTTASSNYGVFLTGSSCDITTTGTGTISIYGTGGGNTNSGTNDGVRIAVDAVVTAVNGDITVVGQGGGAGSGTQNYGVYMPSGGSSVTAIKTTGSGNVVVTGTGGNASGSGGSNYGIYMITVDGIKSTSTGNVTLTGIGGNGSSGSGTFNIGTAVFGYVSSAGGTVTVNGTGGLSTNDYNYGVYINSANGIISNSGTDVSDTVSVVGIGGGTGDTSDQNIGVALSSTSVVSTVDGTNTITGTGGGTGTASTNQWGVYADTAGSTFKTTGSGNLIINGIRGAGTTATNQGVYFHTTTAAQTTGTGNITISTDTIFMNASNQINSAGTLTMATYTNSESIGVAGGTGTLGLTSTFLGYLTYATSLTIGKSTQTGTTTLATYASWAKPISFLAHSTGAITVSGAQTNSSTFTFNGPTSLGSSNLSSTTLTIAGSTFNAGSATITLSGTGTVFSNSGTFTAGTSTISITDSSASTKTFAGAGGTYATFTYAPGAGTGKLVLSGDNTFTSFSDTGTGAHTLEFTAGSTTTVTSFNIESATASVITMQSSSGGSYWNLVDTSGTNQVRYVSITDSCASGGATWDAYTYSADNTNGGHNCGWSFTASFSIAGTANGNDAATVKVAINGSVQGQTGTISASAWTISGVTTPSVNDIITVWVDSVSDANESTAVTKWSSGNITGMVLNTNVLTIGSNQDTSLSLTNIDLFSCADDEDVMPSVISNVLTVGGLSCATGDNSAYSGEVISVLTDDTLTIVNGETLTTEKIENNGTITASGSPTINLTGTSGVLFSNWGSFTPATSEVVVSSASGTPDLLASGGGTTFHRLKINSANTINAGASVTMSSADANNRFYIQSGGFADEGEQIIGTANGTFVMDSGTTLSISEAFVSSIFPTNYTNGNITLNANSTVDYSSTATQTVSGVPTYGHLTISGAGTSTLGASTTVAGNLTVSAGTLALSTLGLSVTGTTSITGTLSDDSATGTNLFTGAVTINSGGIWSTSNNPTFEFRGGLTNNSSSGFTSGSGTYTFSTNAQTLSGTQAFTITALSNTITSGNGLTLSTQYPTITTLTQGTNAVLTISSNTVPTITTLTATASPNTAQYTGSGQTVKGTTYHHLTIGSAGTKTLGGNTTLNGDLTISAGVLQMTQYNLSVTGISSITGEIADDNVGGSGTFTGLVTLNSGGTWNAVNDTTNFYGGLTIDSGSTFSSSSLFNFLAYAQTLGGTKTGITINSINNSTITGNGLIIEDSDITIGTITQDTNSILTFPSTVPTITTLTATASPNTVQYTGGAQTIKGTTYHHLTTSNAGTKTLGGNATVNGTFTIGTSSVLDPTTSYSVAGSGTNTLTLNGTAYVQHSTFAGSYSSFETITPGASSTVDYILDGTQTVDNSISYANLNISTGGTKTLGGATAVSANLTVGTGATLDSSTYLLTATGTNTLSVTGTLIVGGTNFTDSYTGFDTRNLNAGSTVSYGKSDVQNIDNTLSYVHIATSGSGVKTLAGNTVVTGNATIGASTTLDPTTSYTLTGSGTNILTNNGTIRVQHSTFAGSYPSFETKTLTGGTVDYYLGGTQTVDSTLSYGGITISTSGLKTLDGVITATGALTLAGGTLSSGNHYTMNLGSIAMTGGTFTPGDAQINLSGTGTVFNYSSGTYTRSGETINITDSTASSKTFAGGGQTFWNLNFTGTGTGELIISGNNTFNQFRITNPPHTIKFTAGSTQNVKHPKLSGISGSLNTLNSTSQGNTWTINLIPDSYGYVYEQEFLSLRDSTATGNSYFSEIYAGNSTNTANNNGWTFSVRTRGGGSGVESSEDPDPDQGGGGQGGGGGAEGGGGGGGQGGGGAGGGGGSE